MVDRGSDRSGGRGGGTGDEGKCLLFNDTANTEIYTRRYTLSLHDALPIWPQLFDLFYGGKGPGEETEEERAANTKNDLPPVTEETPAFRDIHISNVYCKGSGRAIFFNGLPEMPIENVTVKNVIMSDAKEGVVLSQTRNVTLENVVIKTTTPQPELSVRSSADLTVDGKLYKEVDGKGLKLDFKK